jgi:hypothetical protein
MGVTAEEGTGSGRQVQAVRRRGNIPQEVRDEGLREAPLPDTVRYRMKDSELKASLERAEAAYDALVRTRASLGTMLAQAIRKEGGLLEFRQRREDLPLLLRSADIRRTKLKVELLERRLKKTQEEHRCRAEGVRRADAALEEARKAYTQTVNVEQRSSLEVQRLEALHREELGRLERLLMEEAEQKKEEEEVVAP